MPFNLMAALGLNISTYAAGLFQAEKLAQQFGHKLEHEVGHGLDHLKGAFAAAFGVAAMEQGIERAVQFGAKIQALHEKFDVGTTKLQAYGFAAGQTGAELEDFASAIKKLSVNQGKALIKDDPFGSIAKLFTAAGVSFDDIKNKHPEEIFEQIGERIRTMGADSVTTAALVGLMGKSADNLIPAFKKGIGELVGEFERLNLAIDPGTIKKLEKLEQMMAKGKLGGKKVFAGVAGEISDVTTGAGHTLDYWVGLIDNVMGDTEGRDEALLKRALGQLQRSDLLGTPEGYDVSLDETAERERKLGEAREHRSREEHEADEEAINQALDLSEAEEKLEKKIADLRFAAMTDEQKLLEIARQRLFIKEKLRATKEAGDDVANLEAQKEQLENEAEKRKVQKDLESRARDAYKFDSLAKIGGFSLGDTTGANALKNINERQLEQLREINANTRSNSSDGTGFP